MIRNATLNDSHALARQAMQVFGSDDLEGLKREFDAFVEEEDVRVFVWEEQDGLLGFAQCGLRRDYVEGTEPSPVGYLEGIFVEPAHRHRGIARQLLSACENWASGKGCTEFASDCELANDASLAFHLTMGFAEANRIICFAKKI